MIPAITAHGTTWSHSTLTIKKTDQLLTVQLLMCCSIYPMEKIIFLRRTALEKFATSSWSLYIFFFRAIKWHYLLFFVLYNFLYRMKFFNLRFILLSFFSVTVIRDKVCIKIGLGRHSSKEIRRKMKFSYCNYCTNLYFCKWRII